MSEGFMLELLLHEGGVADATGFWPSIAYSTTLVLVLGRELLSELCISALGDTAAELVVASSADETPSELAVVRASAKFGSLFREDDLWEEFAALDGCKISRSIAAICFP